jgi:hypothetical protein
MTFAAAGCGGEAADEDETAAIQDAKVDSAAASWKKFLGTYVTYSAQNRYLAIIFLPENSGTGHRYFAVLQKPGCSSSTGLLSCESGREEGSYVASTKNLILTHNGKNVSFSYHFAPGQFRLSAAGDDEVLFNVQTGYCQMTADCTAEASAGFLGSNCAKASCSAQHTCSCGP